MSLVHAPAAAITGFHVPRVQPGAMLEALAMLQDSNILHMAFPPDAFHVTPCGTTVDRDLAICLWITVRLIQCRISITPDIVQFATQNGIGPPPSVFQYPFHYKINLLEGIFKTENEARANVIAVQTAGRNAMRWLMSFVGLIEKATILEGSNIPPQLEYLRCLNWREDDAAANPCRDIVPYNPNGPPPPPAPPFLHSPTPLAGMQLEYTPANSVLPALHRTPHVASEPFNMSNMPATEAEIIAGIRELLGQEGVEQGRLGQGNHVAEKQQGQDVIVEEVF